MTQQKGGWLIWISPLLIIYHFIALILCDADLGQEKDKFDKELLCQRLYNHSGWKSSLRSAMKTGWKSGQEGC